MSIVSHYIIRLVARKQYSQSTHPPEVKNRNQSIEDEGIKLSTHCPNFRNTWLPSRRYCLIGMGMDWKPIGYRCEVIFYLSMYTIQF